MTQKFRIEWLAGCVVHCKDFAGSFSLLQWFDLFAFCLLRRQLELFVFGWQLWDTTKQVNKGWWHLKRRHAKEKYWNSRSNTELIEIQNGWYFQNILGYGSSRKPRLFWMKPVVQIEYIQREFWIQQKPLQSQRFSCRFWAIFHKYSEWWFVCAKCRRGLSINVTFVMSSWWAVQKVT